MERWLPVVGWEGFYEVSDLGRVRSLARSETLRGRWQESMVRHRKGKILTQQTVKGYLRVLLSREGRKKPRLVHHLVLEAHVGPRPPGSVGAHGDGIPTNNTPANLRWTSQKDNQADRIRHGTDPRGERNPYAKLTWEAVDGIRGMLAAGLSLNKTAAAFGVSKRTILRIKTGHSWRESGGENAH